MPAIGSAGVGLKPAHFAEALACRARGLWFEVHAENYMVDGGPRLAWLEAIRGHHPLSLHGVGLSLASDAAPDEQQLARLRALVDRFEPALVSEHLAWCTWGGAHYPDLLPFPRTRESLLRVIENVGCAQDALGRRLAIENPAHYLTLDHALGEAEFLSDLCARTGCALLIDVNNVYVGARNLGYCPLAAVDAFPAASIVEVHVAGHSEDPALGAALLVDSHDAPVADAVWSLCERLIARIGPRPILLERDGNLPSFDALIAERAIADALLAPAWEHAA